MARPRSKAELQIAARVQYQKLKSLLDSMSEAERSARLSYGENFTAKEAHWERDRSIRDVLAHLYEWQLLLLNWLESNSAGIAKPFLPEPYNWRNYAGLNTEIWQRHQGTSLETISSLLDDSQQSLIDLIETYSNEELFEKAYFPWTGTTSLGAYFVSATSSHYEWAGKKIRAYLKANR